MKLNTSRRPLPPQPPLPFEAALSYEQTVLFWSSEIPTEGIRVLRDCVYGPNEQHIYDVFSPADCYNAPILVFWHGGGWTNGYKEYTSFMARAATDLGIVLVAPTYRLAPAHKLPAAFDDALAVLSHIREHAARFGGSPDRLYLSGHSAGGHLAALVALRQQDAERAGIDAGAIRACLPISGIMDLHHPEPAKGSMEERVYSMVLENALADATLSPLCWTAGNRIPMYLSYGEFDSERVIRSNQRMGAMLAEQPGPCHVEMETGLDHFGTHTSLRHANSAWYGRLVKLIEKDLG
ncbi:Acetyl esterase/lipase [Paraburkholderia fungorum]|uniref:Acetyl esterase/lipase n=1 Tax=Paraburkholderia fungorum TaxID=134537 RepID=A0A1H1JUP7_9BURK|nr:alpha/beta hydrolase [Paraburkholderia fungorum]SDR53744.1 Acetyl esterase/lipase [Paraburkholderia fungorum]